jgi:putative ABC transport system ATP-binding protein
LVGPSGSGKSTLLRIIAGLQKPSEGFVEINSQRVTCSKPGKGDARVSLIHQDYRLIEFLTVAENLRLGAEARGRPATDVMVADVLALVGLSKFERRMPLTLSGGEQQRVAIARTLMAGPDVILADEPTGALDPANTEAITTVLVRLAAELGTIVLVATHDRQVSDALDRRLRLMDGTICVETRSVS